MRRTLVYIILALMLLPSCTPTRRGSGTTIGIVKPKYHHRWYDRKKDKHTKRTKTVRVRN